MVKLHLCCGDVYLQDYINIDVDGKLAFDCSQEEIDANKTTMGKYFKYPFGTPRRPIIVDRRLNLLEKWDYADNSVDKIVMISCIEHFTKQEAHHVIGEVKRVLKPGGWFVVDFPDIKGDVETYYDNNPQFLMELIYCNWKNAYSAHKYGYTADMFTKLMGDGFSCYEENVVEHDYPMIGMLCIKSGEPIPYMSKYDWQAVYTPSLGRDIKFCNKCGEYVTEFTGCSNPMCPERIPEYTDPDGV